MNKSSSGEDFHSVLVSIISEILPSEETPQPGAPDEMILFQSLLTKIISLNDESALERLFESLSESVTSGGELLWVYFDYIRVFLNFILSGGESRLSFSFAQRTLEHIEGTNSFFEVRRVYKKALSAYDAAWALIQYKSSESYSEKLVSSKKKVLRTKNWRTKSKYGILEVLVSRSVIFEKTELADVSEGLILSLGSTHLATIGGTLYRALLRLISQEDWIEIFLPPLVQLFGIGKESLSVEYAKNLWIPYIIAHSREIYAEMLYSRLNFDCVFALSAQMSILKVLRQEGYLLEIENYLDRIQTCAAHSHADVRVSAFAVVCQNKKRGVPPKNEEINFVRSFIRENFSVDSPSFRQKFCSHFTVIMLRMRDYSMANFRKDTETVENLIRCVDDIEQDLISNIYPGGNYQRTIASLSLLDIMTKIFYSSEECSKKSGVTDPSPLIKHAQSSYGALNFFSNEKNREILIRATLHYLEDVKSTACKILVRFPPPSYYVTSSILTKAQDLSESPKSSECDSASYLYEIAYSWTPYDNLHERLLNEYDHFLNECSQKQNENFYEVIKRFPMHGKLNVLRTYCFKNQSSSISQDFCVHLIKSLMKGTNLMLNILNLKGEEENPSFADIGVSIQSLINEDALIEISYDHQLILSCAWLNLKQCSLTAASLIIYSNLSSPDPHSFALEFQSVQKCADLVAYILKRCRHKGVMEASNLAIMDIAFRLIGEGGIWEEIPKSILCEAFQGLDCQKSSVTRRSAGLPMLVQGIVSSESKVRRKRDLLLYSVKTLTSFASSFVSSSSETRDNQSSHALHVLKALVHDASLSNAMSGYLEDIFICCVDNFASDSWAIRNAALQLFGALIPRLVGQKKVRNDDSEYNVTLVKDFFSKYTSLSGYIFSRLEDISGVSASEKVIPLFTLLSRLGNDEEPLPLLHSFRRVFTHHFYSPVVNVRRLVAKCCTSFLTYAETEEYFEKLFLKALQGTSTNFLHSCCYLLYFLIKQYPKFRTTSVAFSFYATFRYHPCFEIKYILKRCKFPNTLSCVSDQDDSTQTRVNFNDYFFKFRKDAESLLARLKENSNELTNGLKFTVVESEETNAGLDEMLIEFRTAYSSYFKHPSKEIRRFARSCYISFTLPSKVSREISQINHLFRVDKSFHSFQEFSYVFRGLLQRSSCTLNFNDLTDIYTKGLREEESFVIRSILQEEKMFFVESNLGAHPGYFLYHFGEEYSGLVRLSTLELFSESLSPSNFLSKLTQVLKDTDYDIFFINRLEEWLIHHQFELTEGPLLKEITHSLTTVLSTKCEGLKSSALVCLSVCCAQFVKYTIRESIEANDFQFLTSVSKGISYFSKYITSESYRMKALQCAEILSPIVLNLNSEVKTPIFESVWNLLSDEDVNIREKAAEFVSSLQEKNPNCLSNYAAKRSLLNIILKISTDFHHFIPVKKILQESPTELNVFIEDKKDCCLFESESGFNVYADDVDDTLAIYETIHYIKDITQISRTSLQRVERLTDLENNGGYRPFNLLWSDKAYPTLVRLACRRSLLIKNKAEDFDGSIDLFLKTIIINKI